MQKGCNGGCCCKPKFDDDDFLKEEMRLQQAYEQRTNEDAQASQQGGSEREGGEGVSITGQESRKSKGAGRQSQPEAREAMVAPPKQSKELPQPPNDHSK